ncbi:MAG: hypothetical protein ACRDK4_00395 [Solirubrobacteraceae bacterium]
MSAGGRRATRSVLSLCVLALASLVLALGAGSASAQPTFGGGPGEGAGQFVEAKGIALDQETGDVYLADRNNSRIDEFGPGGEFLRSWGWGVADGQNEFQTCGPDAVLATLTCEAGHEDGGAGGISTPVGIAIDNSAGPSHGDVYVEDRFNRRIDKFSASGEFLLAWGWGVADGQEEAQRCGPDAIPATLTCQAAPEVANHAVGEFDELSEGTISVDSAGVVYVADIGRVQEFGEAGLFERQVTLPGDGRIEALAVSTAKDLYVVSGESGVHEYAACAVSCTGEEVGTPVGPSTYGSLIALGSAGEVFFAGGDSSRIIEFAPGGVEVANFPASETPRSMTFADSSDQMYAALGGEVQLISPPAKGPLVESEEATAEPTEKATLNAGFDPEGQAENSEEVVTYSFEYGETGAYGQSTPVESSTGGNFEPRQAQASLSGLKPATLYHYRAVVTNAAHETTDGADETFTTLPALSIESESVSQVSATSARLQAYLNPLGTRTEYHFEYGRTGAYEEGTVPTPDGDAGSIVTPVSVNVLLEHLTPGTTYHYRIVAVNSLAPSGGASGADQTFTTQGPSVSTGGLIDGRSWEMVSPPNKHGTKLEPIESEGGLIQAAENGGALTYFAHGPIDSEPAASRSFAHSQFLSSRSAPGTWSSLDVTPPQETVAPIIGGNPGEYKLFSSDLSAGLVEPIGATRLSPRATERTPYVRESASGEYVPLLPAGNMLPGAKFGGEQEQEGGQFAHGTAFVATSPDLNHVLLGTEAILTNEFQSGFKAAENDGSLYEWSDGALQLVSVLPDGKPAAEEGQGATAGHSNYGLRHVISTDGTRVTFEAQGGGGTNHHLYLRDLSLGQTVQIDTVQAGVSNPGILEQPFYMDATSNGGRIFFIDQQKLTAAADPKGNTGAYEPPDLYMCEVTVVTSKLTCTLKDLSVSVNQGEKADVLGATLGMDQSGRYIYYVAGGVLTHGVSPQGETAHSGADNLYVEDTTTGETRLIVVLGAGDGPDWEAGSPETRDFFGQMTARVSANGRYLAFMSSRSLTGYDNEDVTSANPGERMDQEVYLYQAPAQLSEGPGGLSCVSCDPSGARPIGVFDQGLSSTTTPLLVDNQEIWHKSWLAGSIPGWTFPDSDKRRGLYEPRNLSNSGRIFFNSADGLVAQDTNGVEDVYEYEPDGVGSCALSGGCVGLTSSGISNNESAFLDAGGKGPGGEEGEDVFFVAAAKLVPQDVDGALDIYDAHECSASVPCASVATTLPPACTTADSCRAASTAQQEVFGTPASATFSGAGNVTASQTPGKATRKSSATRTQKLAKALKACERKSKRKRAACERRARHTYGAASKQKRSNGGRGK